MKVMRFFLCPRRFRCYSAVLLLVFLAVALTLWPQHAAGQHPAVPKLTLAQVEQLVSHGVPDSTLSTQIQKRGLAFTPTPAMVESLRAKGAGPLTLAEIDALIPNGAGAGAGRVPMPAISGSASEQTQLTLEVARSAIPAILTKIYRSLDDGNPQAARQFLSGDILNDSHQLDAICMPFSYRAYYVSSVIERPGPVFEARVRTLFKPFEANAQVFTFQPYMGSFMLMRVEKDTLSAEIESAKEAVRQFIFAVRAGRWDVAARYASPGLPLEQMKSPQWAEYFSKITSANASHDGTITKGGILLLIRVDVRNYSSYLPDFLVDPENGLIVRAFFRSPENIFSQLPDPAGFTDPDTEANFLKRFGLLQASLSPTKAAPPNPVEKTAPSLAETMQLIQDTMKEQGQLAYLSESVRNENGVATRINTSGAYDETEVDLATCTLHSTTKYDISWAVSAGDKTVTTEDDHSQFVSTVSFKDVEIIKVESMQDFLNHRNMDSGHPEITYKVTPPVFLVVPSASKPVFSLHVSTTEGSKAPKVTDGVAKECQFLVRDEETANRVAKAMRHAIELCSGGNKEPF